MGFSWTPISKNSKLSSVKPSTILTEIRSAASTLFSNFGVSQAPTRQGSSSSGLAGLDYAYELIEQADGFKSCSSDRSSHYNGNYGTHGQCNSNCTSNCPSNYSSEDISKNNTIVPCDVAYTGMDINYIYRFCGTYK